MKSEWVHIGGYCDVQLNDRTITIGDDLHMNGVDAPARVRGVEGVKMLILVLQNFLKEMETDGK